MNILKFNFNKYNIQLHYSTLKSLIINLAKPS